MNLKEYLFYKDLSLTKFAQIADLSPCHLSSVATGYRKATKKLLRTIERVTDGWVKIDAAFQPTKIPEGFPVEKRG